MDKNESLEKNAERITEIINPTQPHKTSNQEVGTSNGGGLELISIAIAIVAAAGLSYLLQKHKSEPGRSKHLNLDIFQRFARPSCRKCRFFDNNSHLKCAVHPIRVGKISAQDCSDYWQRDCRRFWHR
ncbi:hypothetical protein [Myxosarcina sp. GI1]|uniref:hypothetical protein n=1 Tax=Myxosarcina sp. GI1 TaxID=1541065 RepID=UPI00056562A4|nr:hypothetical protein [Myxosarcina sp. GI1]